MSTVAVWEGSQLLGSDGGQYVRRGGCALNCGGDSTSLTGGRLSFSHTGTGSKEIEKKNGKELLHIKDIKNLGLKQKRKRTTSDTKAKDSTKKQNRSNSQDISFPSSDEESSSSSSSSKSEIKLRNRSQELLSKNPSPVKICKSATTLSNSKGSDSSPNSSAPSSPSRSPLNLLSPRFFQRSNSIESDSCNSTPNKDQQNKHSLLPFRRSESAILHKKSDSELNLNLNSCKNDQNLSMNSLSQSSRQHRGSKEERDQDQIEEQVTFIGSTPRFTWIKTKNKKRNRSTWNNPNQSSLPEAKKSEVKQIKCTKPKDINKIVKRKDIAGIP